MQKPNADNTVIGIVGAGTMGSGIALAALYKGYDVILQDSYPGALEKAQEYVAKFLAKKDMAGAMEKISFSEKLESLAPANVVIEAIIEDISIKQELFKRLDEICPAPAILASNTSTLAVTAIAKVVADASRVGGMHFFNPAPVLPLVEVVRAAETSQNTVSFLVALAEDLGKTPVVTGDTPGFIVNRVARPFYGEALRLLGEGVAKIDEIDALVQQGAGFRMGPFRLMDLIGIDINATAMKSMYEQTFGESRYRPHWIQMQKMQAGTLGRKTGRGFYDYGDSPDDTPELTSQAGNGGGRAVLFSDGAWGPGMKSVIEGAGYIIGKTSPPNVAPDMAIVVDGRDEKLREMVEIFDVTMPPDKPILVQVSDVTLTEVRSWVKHPARVAGIDGLFFAEGEAVTLVGAELIDDEVRAQIEAFVENLKKQSVWISDSPALVLPRIIFMLINEAAFAVLEGVGDADTVDLAMQLGVNYPKGLLAWGREFGYDKVVRVLDHLQAEYGEDRYRACTLLRRWVREADIP